MRGVFSAESRSRSVFAYSAAWLLAGDTQDAYDWLPGWQWGAIPRKHFKQARRDWRQLDHTLRRPRTLPLRLETRFGERCGALPLWIAARGEIWRADVGRVRLPARHEHRKTAVAGGYRSLVRWDASNGATGDRARRWRLRALRRLALCPRPALNEGLQPLWVERVSPSWRQAWCLREEADRRSARVFPTHTPCLGHDFLRAR